MGGVFKKKVEPQARLMELVEPLVPAAWKGVHISVVPMQVGVGMVITNPDNDDEELPVSQAIADLVIDIVGPVGGWAAAQIRLTRIDPTRWGLELVYDKT